MRPHLHINPQQANLHLLFLQPFETMANNTLENEKPGQDHIEHYDTPRRRSSTVSIDQLQHRNFDDRTEEAKGRMSNDVDPSYWYSWRFLGSLFAVGMAFMGGIGGKQLGRLNCRPL